MASSGSSANQNSGSKTDLQRMMDQRKRKRMISNRESARRSRMRKQKLVDDLMARFDELRNENSLIVANLNITARVCSSVEAENSVLKAQLAELTQRLESLSEIIGRPSSGMSVFEIEGGIYEMEMNGGDDDFFSPWNLVNVTQPILANDVFMY